MCKTDKFRPALFCAKDDDTVGTPISGSTGSPSGYYGGTALQIQKANVGTNILKNLRFSNLQTAMDLEDGNFSLYHCQFINCGVGLHLDTVVFYLGNALFANVATNFYCVPEPCYATLENITVDPGTVNTRFCTLEGYEDSPWDYTGGDGPDFSMSIANSLFSGLGSSQMGLYAQVDNTDPLVPLANTVFSSGVGDFQTVGAGNYYLADSGTNRNAGTTNIDPVLLADLRQKTTHPPLWLTNNFTLSTNLMPQALRDTNSSPDLGYHYDAIDFLSSCTVSDATLTLTNGVAIAYYNETCISLLDGAQLNSQGTATNRNYFVHYRLVQEQATNIWVGEATTEAVRCACPLNFSSSTTYCPSATLRFTTFSALAGEVNFFLVEEGGVENFSMRDCEIYEAGAVYEMYPTGTYNLLNNLISYFNGFLTGVADQLCLTNNTFVGGANTSVSIQGASIFNNAFDVPYGVEYNSTPVAAGNNAFLNGTPFYGGFNHSNDIGTNLTWVSGPLGSYYQATGGPLLNQGNTYANLLDMANYTVLTNQNAEGTSLISIGYHYYSLTATNSTDEGAPIVYLSSPTNGQTFSISPTNIVISATASSPNGPIAKVEFYNGTTKLGEADTTPYQFVWSNVAYGTYTLSVKATDSLGATALSSNVNITVYALPSVSITTPTNLQSFVEAANVHDLRLGGQQQRTYHECPVFLPLQSYRIDH